MAVFKYKALTEHKETIEGLVEALSDKSAVDILKDKGLVIISIEEKSTLGNLQQLPFLNKVSVKDIVIFSRQFSVLVSANVALVESLKILVDQTENPRLQGIISEVADEVDGGSRLSDALGKRPKVFSDFFVNVVKSGESSGKLDEVLTYLADEMEKDYDMMSKIKGAMMYPAFVMSGMAVVGVVMMVSVVPKLTAMMSETGAELPTATKLLVALSDFLQSYWWILLAVVIGSFVGMKILRKNPVFRRVSDIILLKAPIFGKLFTLIYLVRFTRSLSTLIVGGVAITKSLEITADVITNSVFKDIIRGTIKEVEDGNSIAVALLESKEIPNMVAQMMSIGEKTGRLDMILERITDFYSREVNQILSNLMTLMEPIIMVIIGIAVGIMVAAIIMPMYNMATAM